MSLEWTSGRAERTYRLALWWWWEGAVGGVFIKPRPQVAVCELCCWYRPFWEKRNSFLGEPSGGRTGWCPPPWAGRLGVTMGIMERTGGL